MSIKMIRRLISASYRKCGVCGGQDVIHHAYETDVPYCGSCGMYVADAYHRFCGFCGNPLQEGDKQP